MSADRMDGAVRFIPLAADDESLAICMPSGCGFLAVAGNPWADGTRLASNSSIMDARGIACHGGAERARCPAIAGTKRSVVGCDFELLPNMEPKHDEAEHDTFGVDVFRVCWVY